MTVGGPAELAGAARFRAILLTSLTTFAGLMPMLTETDMQARFLVPIGRRNDIEFELGFDESENYGEVTVFSVLLYFYGGG